MTAPTTGTVHVTLATFPAHAPQRPPVAPLAPEQPPGASGRGRRPYSLTSPHTPQPEGPLMTATPSPTFPDQEDATLRIEALRLAVGGRWGDQSSPLREQLTAAAAYYAFLTGITDNDGDN